MSAIVYLFILALAVNNSMGKTFPFGSYTKANRTRQISSLEHHGQRIIGGEIAEEAYAPWQVSLQNQYGNHFCGGVILSDEYVLTAANCVIGVQKRNIRVITGSNDWMGEAWMYEVGDIIIHCNFDKPLYHNDIALLKVTTKFAYDAKTQNISIAEEDSLEEGDKLIITGWGNTAVGETQFPNDLRKLEVTYISFQRCKEIYGNSENVDVGHLCTLSPSGEGACHGDTGSPLINENNELVGINNWGVPCGHNFPDVFAKTTFHLDWIRTITNGCKNENKF